MIATTDLAAATATRREVPAAEIVVRNNKSTSSSAQLRSMDVQPATPSDDAAQAEEAQSLAVLIGIMFAILGCALFGSVLTVVLSWRS